LRQWSKERRKYFLDVLRATPFPDFAHPGERGPEVEHPEGVMMLRGVVAVKSKEKT
jgi:hypothetical protein